MTAVAEDEWLPVSESSVWTFANDGLGMPMPHPIHIHGIQFRVIERNRGDIPADLREGVLRAGYKDTFAVFPGEQVRVQIAPTVPGAFHVPLP